jgi:oxalate decarboxylase/phosphoglucose isomerase-like protein (cupin superfamily)
VPLFFISSHCRLIHPITGYIPASYGHYIENTGNSTLKYLELLNTRAF